MALKEGKLPGRKARVGGWTNGVDLKPSVQGGHGSSTSYAQSKGKNKRPGSVDKGKQVNQEFWPRGKWTYTQHHSG